MFGKSCFRLFGKSSVIWNFCNKIFSVQSFFLHNFITFSRIHESKKQQYKRIMFRWLHAIILKFNSADLVWRQLSDLAKKINSNLHPVFTSKKLLMRSKWENPNHLLLMKKALFINTNVICMMQVVWAIDANSYFSALMNISILSLVNIHGTYTTWGTKICVSTLQSSRSNVRSWIV